VKRLRPIPGLPGGIVKYFTREVEVMNVLRLSQHPNILRFIAYYHDRREHILVYEYMDRGSLESYIFSTCTDYIFI
jgi:serine/threonine protein kinase